MRSTLMVIVVCAACGGSKPPPMSHSRTSDPLNYRIEKEIDGGATLGKVIDLHPLRTRAYYTLHLVSEGATALMPRPDVELAASCRTTNELTDVARRNGLCNVPVSEGAFVDRINRLPIDDGLRVRRFLERTLRFTASSDSDGVWSVWPFPHTRDVTAICQQNGRAGLSEGLCEFYSPQHMGEDMRYFEEADTKLLAKRLNELYGVH